MRPFDPSGPLPRGTTVLEASAGTGKTHTIAGLVARYVAEGTRLPEVLVVTFTRMASAELRDRVRTRLVGVADHLAGVLAGAGRGSDDAVAVLLGDGPVAVVRERHRRLVTALTEFDAATIATIHGFCQHVAAGVGLAGDVDRHATLLEDQSDLVEAVVDDCFLRAARTTGAPPPLTRSELLAVARAVVGNPDARVVPAAPAEPAAAQRVSLAAAVRAEVERRKRAAGLVAYDDLLVRLAWALWDRDHGPAARRRLRQRYRVALIDEFQDTDPIQWSVLAQAFDDAGLPLVLIGDPKQAIYAFRGADVHSYLRARQQARTPQTLTTNWRSDAGLLEALHALFDGAVLGHPHIRYLPVEPTPGHRHPRLVDAPEPAPLRLRLVRRDVGLRTVNRGRSIQVDAAREHVAADLAAQFVSLLGSRAALVRRDPGGAEHGRDPLRPGDLAVLVRANAEAALVQRVLRDAGVPAVINGVGSVFATPAATDWLRLLEALERPASVSRARTVALSAFFGWTAEDVAGADEAAWDAVHDTLHRWAAILRDRSVASLQRTIMVTRRLPGRLASRPDGERILTDLGHVGELLHTAAVSEDLGATALSGWLRERIAEADSDTQPEERARRLESDAQAVQVLTVHRAKGLEFPVVACPFLWTQGAQRDRVPLFHDRERGRRVVDVGGREDRVDEFAEHQDEALREQRGEELRLLYVALTRARHQALVWWVPGVGAETSPLGRMLFCRTGDGPVNTRCAKALVPGDDATRERLDALAARAPERITVETVPAQRAAARWQPAPGDADDLDAAPFARSLDHRWRRTSFTALTRPQFEPQVASEPDEPVVDDEALPAGPAPTAAGEASPAPLHVGLPLGDLPGGTQMGTFLHGVLESVDFAAEDLGAELRRVVREQQDRRHVELDAVDQVVAGLRAAVHTPLGPLVDDLALAAFARRDRLDELDFELPLAGGSTSAGGGALTLSAVREVLRAHVSAGDPLAAYADRLADPALARGVRGYLTGSIDCILRLPGPRFVVVDYKSNRLAPPDQEPTAWHYRPAALVEAMDHGHYVLQALLYTVALHRYLRWRLGCAYAPGDHLAGVVYCFLRGMVGRDAPRVDGQPCGVFAWRPPAGLVTDLSDVLDRGRRAA